ncbi:MAG: sodium:solute symporter family protein [Halanaerobiales bacterium]
MSKEISGLLVLLIYAVISIAIGVFARKKSRFNVKDYVTTDSSTGILILIFTFSATYHSAYAFMGAPGWVYSDGVGWWMNGLWTVLPGIALWILGKKIWVLGQKRGYLSMGDYLGGVYDSDFLSVLVGTVGIIFVLPYVAMQAQGLSYILSQMTGGLISFEAGMFFFIGLIVVYVFLGGVRGVAWADTFQGLWMMIAIPLGGYIIANNLFGGIIPLYAEGAQELTEMFYLPGPNNAITPDFWISYWLTITIGMTVMPTIFLRYLMGDSLRTIKWAGVGTSIYLTFIFVFTPAVGIGGKMVAPGLSVADHIFPHLLIEHTPFIFAVITMAGAVAASMSTASSQLHAAASQATVDVYDKLQKEDRENTDKESKKLFNINRYLILVFGVLSLIIALMKLQFSALLQISNAGVATMAPAIILPLYWKGATKEGAISSILGGLFFVVLFQFFISTPGNTVAGFWGIISSFVIFFVVSLLTKSNISVTRHYEFLKKVFG